MNTSILISFIDVIYFSDILQWKGFIAVMELYVMTNKKLFKCNINFNISSKNLAQSLSLKYKLFLVKYIKHSGLELTSKKSVTLKTPRNTNMSLLNTKVYTRNLILVAIPFILKISATAGSQRQPKLCKYNIFSLKIINNIKV